MGNVVSWSVDPAATNIQSFKLYRSICGTTTLSEPFTVLNNYLKFQTYMRDPQLIQLASNDPVDIVNQINTQMVGVLAKIKGVSPTRTILIRSAGSFLKVFETQGSDNLGLAAGNYVPQLSFDLVSSGIPFVSGTQAYTYTDVDGMPGDFYTFTTVDSSSVESSPSVAFQAPNTQVPLCSINGLLLDVQGQPVPNALNAASFAAKRAA